MENTLTDAVTIDAPEQKIWDILTQPEWTEKYMFGCRTICDWRAGSKLDWRGPDGVTYVTGFIEKIEPARLLEYTIVDATKPYAGDRAQHLHVTYSLEKKRLTVTTSGFDRVRDGEARYEDTVKGGGWKPLLEKIKALAEAAS
jgi:uncharacterized protein YndB with AHSA1/START domain